MKKLKKVSLSSVTRKAIGVFTNNVLGSLFQFLLGVYFVRVFGAEGRGTYALLTSSASICAIMLSLGIANSIIYHVKTAKLALNYAMKIALAHALSLVAFIGCLLVLFNEMIWDTLFYGIDFQMSWLVFVLVYTPVVLFSLLLKSYFLAVGCVRWHRWLSFFVPALVLLFTVGVTQLHSANIAVALFTLLFVEFTMVIAAMLYGWGESGKHSRNVLRNASLCELYIFGLKGHLGVVGTTILNRIDIFIVAAYISIEAAGYYAVARFFYQSLMSIPLAFNGLLLGRYCDAPSKAITMNCRVVLFFGMLMVSLAVFAAWAAGTFIPFVYGYDLQSAVAPLYALLVAAVFMGVSSPCSALFTALGRPELVSLSGIAASGAKLAFTLLLIQQYAIVGVAIATAIGGVTAFSIRIALFLSVAKRGRLEGVA